MSLLGINNWIVAWTPVGEPITPTSGKIRIDRFANNNLWSRDYDFIDGAVWSGWSSWPLTARVGKMMFIFHTIVVRDGIDPQLAHRQFLKIAEYRQRISSDIKGSTNPSWF